RSRSSRTWGGMRWTRRRRKTSVAQADGKVVWSCHPDAGVKLAGSDLQATVAKEPGHRGEHGISRKPLRGECRVISGVTVVTMLVRFFIFACEAAGAAGARYSLRPRIFRGRQVQE